MKIIIDGTPYEGEWDLPDFFFTNRELHRIKVVSDGIRAGELIDALEANDTSAFVAVATVAVERTGKKVDPELLWDAPVGSITLRFEEDVADVPLDDQSGDGPSSSGDSSTPSSESGSDS